MQTSLFDYEARLLVEDYGLWPPGVLYRAQKSKYKRMFLHIALRWNAAAVAGIKPSS